MYTRTLRVEARRDIEFVQSNRLLCGVWQESEDRGEGRDRSSLFLTSDVLSSSILTILDDWKKRLLKTTVREDVKISRPTRLTLSLQYSGPRRPPARGCVAFVSPPRRGRGGSPRQERVRKGPEEKKEWKEWRPESPCGLFLSLVSQWIQVLREA